MNSCDAVVDGAADAREERRGRDGCEEVVLERGEVADDGILLCVLLLFDPLDLRLSSGCLGVVEGDEDAEEVAVDAGDDVHAVGD